MDGFGGYLRYKIMKVYLFSLSGVVEKMEVGNVIKVRFGSLDGWCYWEDQVCKIRCDFLNFWDWNFFREV